MFRLKMLFTLLLLAFASTAQVYAMEMLGLSDVPSTKAHKVTISPRPQRQCHSAEEANIRCNPTDVLQTTIDSNGCKISKCVAGAPEPKKPNTCKPNNEDCNMAPKCPVAPKCQPTDVQKTSIDGQGCKIITCVAGTPEPKKPNTCKPNNEDCNMAPKCPKETKPAPTCAPGSKLVGAGNDANGCPLPAKCEKDTAVPLCDRKPNEASTAQGTSPRPACQPGYKMADGLDQDGCPVEAKCVPVTGSTTCMAIPKPKCGPNQVVVTATDANGCPTNPKCVQRPVSDCFYCGSAK